MNHDVDKSAHNIDSAEIQSMVKNDTRLRSVTKNTKMNKTGQGHKGKIDLTL